MPRGDGTGPMGPGGGGQGRGGGGRGQGGGFAAGSGGNCVCPQCGKTIAHGRGTPCNQMKCPDCGSIMTRQM